MQADATVQPDAGVQDSAALAADPHAGHDMAAMPTTEAVDVHGETHEGTEHAEGHAAGGLPQFDMATWPGQIAWFLIVFLVVFLLSKFVFVPKIGGAIDAREGKIEGDIAEARKLKAEADAAAEAAAAELAQARASAQKVAGDARTKAQGSAAEKLAAEEAKLAEAGAAAEARIAQARAKAMGAVAQIASDTASTIVQHLTGSAASAKELASGRA